MNSIPKFESRFFAVHDEAGVTVLDVQQSQLTEEENLEDFDRELRTLQDTYHIRQIVLDLSRVNYMTSSAIGKLITLHRRLARNQGQLVICSLRPAVEDVLETSQLLRYFSVSPSPDAALARFN